jgi:hypothetical protein
VNKRDGQLTQSAKHLHPKGSEDEEEQEEEETQVTNLKN